MLFRAMISHYRRHPLQLASLALMIVIATMLWTGVSTLTDQARASLSASEASITPRQQIIHSGGQPVTTTDFVNLRRAGVCVVPWLEGRDAESDKRVIGIDPLAMGCFEEPAPGGENDQRLNGQRLDGAPFVDISQVAAGSGQLVLLVSSRTVSLPAIYKTRAFSLGPATGELADSFLLNLDALSLLVLFITGLLVRSVYHLGLAQRRSSFALLRRFGVAEGQTQRLLAAELVILTLLCVIPGVWLGQGLANGLQNGFGQALGSLFDVTLYQQGSSLVHGRTVVVMVALVLGVCFVDRLLPASRRSGMSRRAPVLWLILLLASGLLTVALAPSLVWAFAGAALVFAGVGGLIPGVLSRWADWCARRQPNSGSEQALALWRYRELAVMVRRLALPVMALQFAMATVLAVQALVTTFETTFEHWLAQRLSADFYVEVPQGASAADGAGVLGQLEGIGAWHQVTRGRAENLEVDGRTLSAQVDLMALSSSAAKQATVSPLVSGWTLLDSVDDPWRKVADGAVMINEQLSLRYDIGIGDSLQFELAGQVQKANVAAVYADYGRPSGEVLVSGRILPKAFDARSASFSINAGSLNRHQITEPLQTVWQAEFVELRDAASIQSLASRVFQQTFALTRAISILALVLASVALLIMGWVFFITRAWYFRLLIVWGVPLAMVKRQLRRLSVTLTVSIAVLALPLGIGLTWVLVSRVNPLAFGWSLPMAAYPMFWVQLGALAGVTGLTIAWLMGRQLRLSDTSVAEGKAVEGPPDGGER